ncbi:CaiB/BaiF CoA-transferase family protein [soil metagenome]
MAGVLAGVRIVEIAGIGPGPFAAMMLADHGAEVIRIERAGGLQAGPEIVRSTDVLTRSRRSVTIDLKTAEGREVVKMLVGTADGFIEGFRPGTMERLGLGPDTLLELNPRLVYGRMTGWGQNGPYAQAAGHDINYIALAGALHAFGRAGDKPTAPINMIGDFGGGGMLLAFGMVSAILAARTQGRGQVVDCAMTDGAALLMSMIWGFRAQGMWTEKRGTNLLDGGAHFYDTYETSDGGFIAIGAIEPAFYTVLLERLGLTDDVAFQDQMSASRWPDLAARLTALFKTRTRAEWCEILEATDACFAPVLTMSEAPSHQHNRQRRTFVTVGGVVQPAPAPRFSVDPAPTPRAPSTVAGEDTSDVLLELGFTAAKIAELRAAGVVR